MRKNNVVRTLAIFVLVLAAIAGIGALVVRDQIARHKRELFNAHAFRRFAALSYLARMEASLDLVQTLRDFVAREPRSLLRNRARQILERMEKKLARSTTYTTHAGHGAAGEFAG